MKSINQFVPPNLDEMPLIANIQAYEQYGSSALNRQLRGIIKKGVYNGFELAPADSGGLKIKVTSNGGESAGVVEIGNKWLINIKQQFDVELTLPAGQISTIVLSAFYDGKTETNQVNADSKVKSAQLLVVGQNDRPASSIVLGQVNVPSGAVAITQNMIDLLNRERASIEGFWDKLLGNVITPKGQWIRTYRNLGIKPSLDNVRSKALESVGTNNAWFSESWFNSYRGGSIDVEGAIRSGGRLAMLRGDFGFGGPSKLLAEATNLDDLPDENATYRGVNLLNAPEGSQDWFHIEHISAGVNQYQRATNFSYSKSGISWFRVGMNGRWSDWDAPYSKKNSNIGTAGNNYAAGNHSHSNYLPRFGSAIHTSSSEKKIKDNSSFGGLEVRQDNQNGDSAVTFHCSGNYALNFGLDSVTKKLSVGGWSMGAVSYDLYHAGNRQENIKHIYNSGNVAIDFNSGHDEYIVSRLNGVGTITLTGNPKAGVKLVINNLLRSTPTVTVKGKSMRLPDQSASNSHTFTGGGQAEFTCYDGVSMVLTKITGVN